MQVAVMATAVELLEKVKAGMRWQNVQLEDVEEILANDTFCSDMMATTENGNTLLHWAAMGRVESVLPLVMQAYKRAKLFPTVLASQNENKLNPLHVAICHGNFENTVILFNECLKNCQDALKPRDDGCSLFHLAADNSENVNVVKFLLTHKICEPLVLTRWSVRNRELMPLDVARSQVFVAEHAVQFAKNNIERMSKTSPYNNPFHRRGLERSMLDPKKKILEKVKEIVSMLEQPTMELKAKEAEERVKELERKKHVEKEQKDYNELQHLLQENRWQDILENYFLSDDEETQKITISFLAKNISQETSSELPPLSLEIVGVLMRCLKLPEDDPVLISSLELFGYFSNSEQSSHLLCSSEEGVETVSTTVTLLSSLKADIQRLCGTALANLLANKPESFVVPNGWIQTLLLVKHFSLNATAKSLAAEALRNLHTAHQQPDPGTWSVKEVSFWIESITNIEKRSEYRTGFADGGIDGLHLLELSVAEMTALGVKFVFDQRKLSSAIDELRRMNLRKQRGKKDVFLSYPHISIQFARKIKKALNSKNYTVWIDETGIRAGQKWRNEIAEGIEGCRVLLFVMTPRSANSEYCQDELALAQEYKRPILTVMLQDVPEMDPGLRLITRRRQWIDFMDEVKFETNCEKLLEAIRTTVGEGSGPEREEEGEESTQTEHDPKLPEPHPNRPTGPSPQDHSEALHTVSLAAVQEIVREEVTKVRNELQGEIEELQQQLQTLERKVQELSMQ